MNFRTHLGAAALAVAALTACGPSRQQPDAGGLNPPTGGCVGVCSDAGAGAGPADAGNDQAADAGTSDAGSVPAQCASYQPAPAVNERTLAQLRAEQCYGPLVLVKGAVVVAFENDSTGSLGDTDQNFWVVDPSNPTSGIFVDKQFADSVDGSTKGRVDVGDKVDIEGYVGTMSWYSNQTAYRLAIKGYATPTTGKGGSLKVTKVGAVTPPAPNPVSITTGFGNADGGFARPNPELGSTLVQVTDRLEVTNPTPVALQPLNGLADGGNFYGYEVTGGILVVDRLTNGNIRFRADGGTDTSCDWRTVAVDAGANGQVVAFPAGIKGVWDTYSHAPCADGGTSLSCFALQGVVPGTRDPATDAGNNYTYVLYPQGCADVPGEVVTP